MWLESAGTYKYLINSLFTTIQPNDFVIVEDPNNQVYGSLSDITYNFTINDNAWITATNTGTAFQWGGGRWYIDGNNSKIATLTSPDIPQGVYSVSISHRWNFEFCCDGGQVEYSTNNGTTWTALPFNETNPYSNGGSTAWASNQSSIVTSTAKLFLSNNPLSNFKLRLRAFWDGSVLNTNPNWQIYSVSLSPLLGKVNYVYRINKYEITNNEYCLFLNSVDPYGSNPNSIYNSQMSSSARGGITLESTRPSGYLYRVKTNMGDKPANFVSWFSAARFCNWLHNGAKTYLISDASVTAPQNTGAYTVSTATSSTVPVSPNPGAKYRIPTLSEWIKAGYYKGDSVSAGYWTYPTQYDAEPQCVSNVTSDGYPVILPLYQTLLVADIITDLPQPTSVYSSRLAIDALTTNLDGLLIDSSLSADLAIIEKVWREDNHVISRLACDICVGDIVLPVITIQQQPPAIIKQTSSSATISVSPLVTLDQTLSYQWQKKDFGSSTFQDVVGATSSTLSLTGLNGVDDDRDQYRCKISATGGASDLFSNVTEIIFNTIITITQQPTNTSSSTGTASFSISATTSPSTILWYQWEVAKANDPSNFTLITSPQNLNSTLSLSNLIYEDNHNDIYRCKLVTEDNTGFLYSNTATLQISPAIITITSQPPASFKPSSGNASISVQASIGMGGTLSYQWQRKPNGGSYSDIVGATGDTLSLSGLVEATNDLDSYRCAVSGNRGASTVISNESAIFFNTLITITTQPQDFTSPDGNATFSCEATSDPLISLYYIWQKAESSNPLVFTDISAQNNTNDTLSLSGLTFENDSGDKYRCRIVASDGTGQTISSEATLTLPDPSATPTITITQQPKNTLVTNLNNKVAISGLATVSTGAIPTYTWEYLNSIASGVSDTALMNNANWEPIISNKILFNFDGTIQDSGDFTHTITNNNATISTTTKKYGSGSLFCANGNVRISPSSGFVGHKFALNSDFTIEGWFYFNANDIGYQPLICADRGGDGDASAWALIIEADNTIAFYGVSSPWSGGLQSVVSTSFTPNIETWHHICVMRENRTIKIFVDGTQVVSYEQPSGESRFLGGHITIGGYNYFPDFSRNFNGYIDDVRIVHGKAVYDMLGFSVPSNVLSKYSESTTSISKHFINDLTIDGVDDIFTMLDSLFYPPTRDKRIRLKVTSPGVSTVYSKIIRYVFPVSGIYSYFGPQDGFFNPLPDTEQTETVNGVVYKLFFANVGDDLLAGVYDDSGFFGVPPPADTSWYNDDGSSVTLEYSPDAINWTLASSGGFKYGSFGTSVILDIPTENSQKSVYYRVKFFDTWPYETNNDTDSTPATTYFFNIFNNANFKINWDLFT